MKYLVFLFFIISFFLHGQDVPTAKWKRHVNIDGLATEWNLPLGFYNSETKLFFAVANDSSNIYLCFQSNDEGNQIKINCAGMKITLSTKGKGKKEASVIFPLTDSKNRYAENDMIAGKKVNMLELKNTFIVQNVNMEVKGFATQNGIIPLKDSSGINAAINWNDDLVMSYELAIPFKEFFGKNYTTDDLTKTMALEVEVNAVTRPDEGGVDGSAAAAGSTGMGATAGMTGGMPSAGGTKERKPIFDRNRFKEKFVLRSKP